MAGLKDFESVAKALQLEESTVSLARSMFDKVLEKYPNPVIEERLRADASIVQNPNFETGIAKIQDGHADQLTELEKVECEVLRAEEVETSGEGASADQRPVEDDNLSLAEQVLKRRKVTVRQESSSKYMDLRFLLGTANICERFFSRTGFALTDRRKSILPVNFEMQMFLYSNSSEWDLGTFYRAIIEAKNSKQKNDEDGASLREGEATSTDDILL